MWTQCYFLIGFGGQIGRIGMNIRPAEGRIEIIMNGGRKLMVNTATAGGAFIGPDINKTRGLGPPWGAFLLLFVLKSRLGPLFRALERPAPRQL